MRRCVLCLVGKAQKHISVRAPRACENKPTNLRVSAKESCASVLYGRLDQARLSRDGATPDCGQAFPQRDVNQKGAPSYVGTKEKDCTELC